MAPNGGTVGAGRPDRDAEFARLRPYLRSLAYRLSGDGATADDLVQETMERVLRADTAPPGGADLRAWSTRVLRNRFIDLCRRNKRRRAVPLDERSALGAGPPIRGVVGDFSRRGGSAEPEPAWASITLEDVRAAAAELPDKYGEIYRMRVFEDLDYNELGRRLGLKRGTVAVRLHRARLMLRKRLLERFGGEAGR